MDVKIIGEVAVVYSDTPIITDAQSALDLTVTVSFEYRLTKMAINKEAIDEAFFKLSTGFAGEVVQKFVNYRFSVAIIGDFSKYTSKPLRDFMYECNQGKHIFFVADEAEAIARLNP